MQPKEVRRYRAGQRPTWDKVEKEQNQFEKKVSLGTKEVVEDVPDSRLSRLEKAQTDPQSDRLSRHKRIIEEAAVLAEDDPAGAPEEGAANEALNAFNEEREKEMNLEGRRQRARQQHQDEQEELPVEENEDADDDMSSEEEESESPEDWDQFMPSSRPKIQPKFVMKGKRQTIQEKDSAAKEELKLKEEKEKQIQERKERTKQILVEAMEREKVAKSTDNGEEVAITDDEDDEETQLKEYELWKRRELMRIKREHDEREKFKVESLR
uniref:Micro-fibrillar-associated protein 1 C-terminal domain-containing protein n=1 Tax=Arcella intermedia TaxID=1963864 RepID=A0A6B2LDX5_9EUKA